MGDILSDVIEVFCFLIFTGMLICLLDTLVFIAKAFIEFIKVIHRRKDDEDD